ncbi:MAG: DNA repair protein [Cyclobacteriaceae bacterium]|nr:DNA repair protein [Cyclobacteriaceae bacterium]
MENVSLANLKTVQLNIIQFPEIALKTRDAHKLRGYFGNLFREHSSLLHNHYENGEFRYRYPLVQYKVINSVPSLVAIEEGAELLSQLFLKIKRLDIEGRVYDIQTKNIVSRKEKIGYADELKEYKFETLWMALNQDNYKKYRSMGEAEQSSMLNKILVGHVLSFYKQMELFLEGDQRLLAKSNVEVKNTQFKDQKMIAFAGSFLINAYLPELIGLGKSVSRGFGTIKSC